MPHNERNCGTMAAALADREMPDPMVDTLEMFFVLGQLRQRHGIWGKESKKMILPNPRVETHHIARC